MSATEWAVMALNLFVKLVPSFVALAIGLSNSHPTKFKKMSLKVKSRWGDSLEFQTVSDDREKI